jgi:hypothetical protein
MERDDLERVLCDDEIVPSSGFVARVMDAVRIEAEAPPAIPFPWVRALPGIIAAAVALIAVVVGFAGFLSAGSEGPAAAPVETAYAIGAGAQAAWLFVVLLLCTVPLSLSVRITRGHF